MMKLTVTFHNFSNVSRNCSIQGQCSQENHKTVHISDITGNCFYHKCPVLTGNYTPFLTENFLLCGVINYIPSSLRYGTTVGIAIILC